MVLGTWCREKDLNLRRHTPADLQSAPFGRSGIPASPETSGGFGTIHMPRERHKAKRQWFQAFGADRRIAVATSTPPSRMATHPTIP